MPRWLRPMGGFGPREASARLLSRGRVAGAIEIAHDVTEAKHAQKLFVESAKFRAVADLTSGVAHNFNNLLQVVIGNASLGLINLRSGDLTDLRENLEQILESSRFGAETVNRLSRYARASDEYQSEATEVFDLSELVRQSVEMSRPWWKAEPLKRGIHVNLDTRLKTGCTIRGNKNELFEVAVNLLKNAAEAVEEGGDIEIDTAIQGDSVILRVSDTGKGMPEENLNGCLLHSSRPAWNRAEGWDWRQVAKSSIHMEDRSSLKLRGSWKHLHHNPSLCFRSPVPARGRKKHEPFKGVEHPGGRRSEATVRMLKAGLSRWGHEVTTALSGEEAVTIFKENRIDLVICDLGMTGMSGWEVAGTIRTVCREKEIPRTPFIVLTGWEDQENEWERRADSGVDAVVQKPVEIARLLEIIREVMQKNQTS